MNIKNILKSIQNNLAKLNNKESLREFIKKSKYLIFAKLAIKIVIILIAVFYSSFAFSQDANTHYFKSLAELKYNNTEKAFQEINMAINYDKKNTVFLIQRGNMYYFQSNYNFAINDYRKAEKIKQYSASLLIAKSYSMQNNVDSAIFFLTKYLKYYNKISKPKIKSDTAFENIKNTEQWIKLWSKNHYSKVDNELSEAQYYFDYDQPFEALEGVNNIIKTHKQYHKAYFLKAKILIAGNNYKEAIKSLNKAINYSPQNTDYYQLRANSYFILKKYNNSIADYQVCLKTNPLSIEIYHKFALAYAQKKMYIKALEIIDYYTQIFYQDYDAIFDKAKINYDAGNFLETIKIMNKLIEIDTHNAEYYSLRGKAFLNSNSFELAYTDLTTALDINPKQTDNYYYMGIANFKLDKTDEACADWKKAIDNKDYKANEYFYEHCKPKN